MEKQEINWYAEEAATFGDRLAGAREASGMTQAQLAKNLGVKLSTLKAWEQDLSEPRANRLSMLAGLLNVSIMWLLNGEGEGIDPPDKINGRLQDANDLFLELRSLRAQFKQSSDRLGAIEKRLREVLGSDIQ
jgi:transcriptional regulator with XRE-family HTH domain